MSLEFFLVVGGFVAVFLIFHLKHGLGGLSDTSGR
jgi:hypothetical protein